MYRFYPLIMAVLSLTFSAAYGQTLDLAGKVADDSGRAIQGAVVQVKGRPQITVQSGADGTFRLTGSLALSRWPGSIRLGLGGSGQGHLADGRVASEVLGAEVFLLRRLPEQEDRGDAGRAKVSAAACTLTVTKSGYKDGSFPQNSASATGLVLGLAKPVSDIGGYAAEKKVCLDRLNGYRATLSLKPLVWAKELEVYADEGAKYDSERGTPHGHFGAVRPNPARAENETPGWPLSSFKTVQAVVEKSAQMMWDEGPGGGHYENIRGNYTTVGCGIYVTPTKNVWVIHDFR